MLVSRLFTRHLSLFSPHCWYGNFLVTTDTAPHMPDLLLSSGCHPHPAWLCNPFSKEVLKEVPPRKSQIKFKKNASAGNSTFWGKRSNTEVPPRSKSHPAPNKKGGRGHSISCTCDYCPHEEKKEYTLKMVTISTITVMCYIPLFLVIFCKPGGWPRLA